ncbi:hypothetical protein [Amycolatopsis sp. CA-230715]|uniref:hypothetical protein n=1 Tax=Amycolatopsis sp. CA-230715 TaxID=2745196 RepID=UPI001C321D5C|nr:hypothetical protein [Amycolatopsis sp. CA-230715]QWF78480.1 hypothetical protein HUW46_01876 [Amycolatopsis sp. CA-230715]
MGTKTMSKRLAPTRWTPRLGVLVAVCSVVFVVGTAVQTFAVITPELMERSMALSGRSAEEIAAESPGFLRALRLVGIAFIPLNALGVLAFRYRWSWLFWAMLVISAGQAAGVVAGMVPPTVLRASIDLYGPLGVLPTLVTDGCAALLSLILLGFLLKYRTPWAQLRED